MSSEAGAKVAGSTNGVVISGRAGTAGKSLVGPAGTIGLDGASCSTEVDSMKAFNAKAVPVSRWHEVQWQQ